MATEYYEILGIDRSADVDAIQRAYRKRALKLHPDRNKSLDAKDAFMKIAEARDTRRTMPPFPRSEALAGAATSLFSFALTPCRRYFPGYKPRGHPYAAAAADPGDDACGPRYATAAADPCADALGQGEATSGGKGGGARKKQDRAAPAYPASGRGKPVV
ncbi:MAG: hypothetical protein BJ554DRAFT_1884, partial [Olpidium bornovanus]